MRKATIQPPQPWAVNDRLSCAQQSNPATLDPCSQYSRYKHIHTPTNVLIPCVANASACMLQPCNHVHGQYRLGGVPQLSQLNRVGQQVHIRHTTTNSTSHTHHCKTQISSLALLWPGPQRVRPEQQKYHTTHILQKHGSSDGSRSASEADDITFFGWMQRSGFVFTQWHTLTTSTKSTRLLASCLSNTAWSGNQSSVTGGMPCAGTA